MVARLLKIAFFFAPRYLGQRKSRRDEFEDILKGKFCVSDDRLLLTASYYLRSCAGSKFPQFLIGFNRISRMFRKIDGCSNLYTFRI